MAERAGRKCAELVQPEVDRQAQYLLRWFGELSQGRQNGMGANPISWCEMEVWARMTGRHPNEWEVETLRAIDWGYLND